MEFLALAAAVATITQLVHYSDGFASYLRDFARTLNTAKEEVGHFASQLQTFAHVTGLARTSIQEHYRKYPESPVFTYIREKEVLENLNEELRFVRRRLKEAKRRVYGVKGSKSRILMKIRWSLNKKSILGIFPEMESVKTILNLMVSIATLERLGIEKRESPGSSAEVEELEKEM